MFSRYIFFKKCFDRFFDFCTYLQLELYMLKDATMGFVCIQTVCYSLWDTLSIWTQLCVSQTGFLRDWWYLVPQYALDYSDLMGFASVRLQLAQANWPNYVTLSWAVMPKQSVLWPTHPGMLVDLL